MTFETGGGHAVATHTEEAGSLPGGCKALLKRVDQESAVVFATGLTRRNEDVGTGHACARLVLRWQHHSGFDITVFQKPGKASGRQVIAIVSKG